MLANVTFYNDQELPTTDLIWTQPDGTSLYNFSSGWTFSLRLARVTAPATTVLLKTTGITGAATSPNLSIAWSTSDWSGLEASTNGTKYVGAVYARRTADSYDMAANISVTLKAAPGTSAVSPSSYPITVTAASVTFAPSGSLTATDAQAAITEASTDLDAHLADTVNAHDASAIRFVPTGTVAATDVQAAIAEVASEAAPLSALNGVLARPTAATVAQTMPRVFAGRDAGTAALTAGQQSFVLVWLPTGVVSSITFISGTTSAGTPTNQWFAIYDVNRNKLAVTSDDTSTAWSALTAKTLTISGGYTVATAGFYYLGVMVAAAIAPTLSGFAENATVAHVMPPVMFGRDATNTGLTTPATAPASAAAFTATAFVPYAYVS